MYSKLMKLNIFPAYKIEISQRYAHLWNDRYL